jgi:SAM-dependent methyltransferase
MKNITAQELYAQLYDVHVSDWQGEVDFYRELIVHSPLNANGVLEVACGTGRVTLQLAKDGVDITGLDISPELLEIARRKSIGIPNVNWVLGDMRTFDIGTKFGYVILPGHSFQFMTTPDEQVKCLEQIKRHLVDDGLLIIHHNQDFGWLAVLLNKKEPFYEESPILTHPTTSRKFRQSSTWTFEPSTQSAIVTSNWEEVNEDGIVIQTWAMEPMPLHCIFRFEMEHLLKRAGFSIEAVYGDFFKSELTNESEQMIWLARNKAG